MTLPILTTKLYEPRLNPNQVRRARLIERLDEGMRLGRRLTLISAPPGYGKTTLVAEWLQALSQPEAAASSPPAAIDLRPCTAWLSLDEGDNDPARFFTYLSAALLKADADLGTATRSLLGTPQLPPLEAVAATLINEIAALERGLVLVLDDYHTVRSPYVNAALEFVMRSQPPNLHLVLITRQDPPFSVAQARARGQLTEIRAADLRFTMEEAIEFLNGSMKLGLDAEIVAALESRTEGWIASLQLVALSLQGLDAGQARDFVDSFRGSHRYIIDYLLEEVVKRQPESIQRFLYETSILEKLSAGLCEAVFDSESAQSAQTILENLERTNLFLIPLDNQRGWFRYHHLFADVLRVGLDNDVERGLHRKAAGWYEANGHLLDAIRHSLAGEDYTSAARLVGQAAGAVIQSGELTTLHGWLKLLPEAVIQANPDLALYRAAVLVFTGQAEAGQQVAGLWEQLTASGVSTAARGRLLALRAWISVTRGAPEALGLAGEALRLLGEDDSFFRVIALLSTGTGLGWTGEIAGSTQAYRDAWEIGRGKGYVFAALGALANLVFNRMDQGDLNEAEALCQEALRTYVDRRGQALPILGIIYLPLAVIRYERDELDEAERYARLGLELCQKLFSSAVMGGDGEMVLARVAMARGRTAEAFAVLSDTREEARRKNIAYLGYKMDLQETGLLITQGDLPAAERLLGAVLASPIPGAHDAAEKLQAQLLLAQGQPAQALEQLDRLEASAREKGLDGKRIHLHVFQAEAYLALGEPAQAQRRLEEALRLAAPHGYKRCFTRKRSALRGLLISARAAAPGFVDELLGEGEAAPAPANRAVVEAQPQEDLAEPLSEQERKVLRLVCAGLSNQEVAAELVIGVGTAKWHVHNVLGKLGVSSRAQAVVRATELGLN